MLKAREKHSIFVSYWYYTRDGAQEKYEREKNIFNNE
jgi:hypothetical protein